MADIDPASAKSKGALSPFFCAYRLTLYVDPASTPKRAEIALNVRFMGYGVPYPPCQYKNWDQKKALKLIKAF